MNGKVYFNLVGMINESVSLMVILQFQVLGCLYFIVLID